LDPRVIPIWQESLSSELSDEEFDQAVREAVLNSQFFPTAKQLIGFAKAGNEVQAVYEWRTFVVAIAQSSNEEYRENLLSQMSKRGRIALDLIGGTKKVENCDEKWLDKLGHEFQKAYCQAPSNIKVLKPSRPESVYSKYQAEEEKPDQLPELTKLRPEALACLERAKKYSEGETSLEEVYKLSLSLNGWQISGSRFNYFLRNIPDDLKPDFLQRFKFQVRQNGRNPVSAFDDLSGYKPDAVQYNQRAVADEWLKDLEF
jgi:hypothetical protein